MGFHQTKLLAVNLCEHAFTKGRTTSLIKDIKKSIFSDKLTGRVSKYKIILYLKIIRFFLFSVLCIEHCSLYDLAKSDI